MFDWQGTSSSRLQVNIRVNDSDAASGGGGPPDVQRWNQAMNLATNAFLTFSQVCSAASALLHCCLPLLFSGRIEGQGPATDVHVHVVVLLEAQWGKQRTGLVVYPLAAAHAETIAS